MSKSTSKLSLSLSAANYALLTFETEDYPSDSFEYTYILSVNFIALFYFIIQGAYGLL